MLHVRYRFIDVLSGVGRGQETGSADQQGWGFSAGTKVENPPAMQEMWV